MRTMRRGQAAMPVDQQGDLTWRYPDRRYSDREHIAGPVICPRCHASLEQDHWRFNPGRYRELQEHPDIQTKLCPGCSRVERRLYEGEVIARHDWSQVAKEELLHLIHHEEARARATNPTARIALMEDHGDEIYLLTTTQFLARRIGTELRKAYRGTLEMHNLPRERFSRVRWTRV